MPGRYKVTETMDRRMFGILDLELWGFCSLVDENGESVRLEWYTKNGAQAWLNMCYRNWWDWSKTADHVKVPDNWKPLVPRKEVSPFDRGFHGYQDL